MASIFVAYPGAPAGVGENVTGAKALAAQTPGAPEITTWQRDDLGGSQVLTPILQAIANSDVVAGDITILNFNVTYELGYALGLGKRVLPLLNDGLENDLADCEQIGIFDTLVYQRYANSAALLTMLGAAEPGRRIATNFPFDPLPLYIILPPTRTNEANQLLARANRAGLRPRTFDPGEQPRLSAVEAARSVGASYGVAVQLLAPQESGARIHNIRAAFVIGLAHALERPTLILQKGTWATPLDVRDEVQSFTTDEHLKNHFQEFAERVHDTMHSLRPPSAGSSNVLANLNLGDPAAENEEDTLDQYFLEREEFRQVLSGRANIVVGRKGSGKTAVFFEVRDNLRADRNNVVVNLSPESHQLRKLKDSVLRWLAAGSKEFLLTAFWEYVLLLELCGKLLEKDRDVHKRNHTLFDPYQRLLKYYREETATEALDFSGRLLKLVDRVATKYQQEFGESKNVDLGGGQLTNILHATTLHELKSEVVNYAKVKGEIFVLFDNIDKAWNANGLEDSDVVMIRTLIEASRKLGNDFRREGTKFHCAVFLRNDVYEALLSNTPDRGKDAVVLLDWVQPDHLKQMVRKRLLFGLDERNASVDQLWQRICVPLVSGESSLDYLTRLSLMRPRYLLRLINHCKGSATGFGRDRIDEGDIEKGLSLYSTDVVTEIDLEIRDVLPSGGEILFVFLGERREMKRDEIMALLSSKLSDKAEVAAVFALLLWHGVLGYRRSPDTVSFIYDVNYDLRRLTGLMDKDASKNPLMQINPAFWPHLELIN